LAKKANHPGSYKTDKEAFLNAVDVWIVNLEVVQKIRENLTDAFLNA